MIDKEKWAALAAFYGLIFLFGLGYYKIIPLLFGGTPGVSFENSKMMPYGEFIMWSAVMFGIGIIFCFIVEKVRTYLEIK